MYKIELILNILLSTFLVLDGILIILHLIFLPIKSVKKKCKNKEDKPLTILYTSGTEYVGRLNSEVEAEKHYRMF